MVCWNSGTIYSKQLHSWQFILFQGWQSFSVPKTARKINDHFNGPWLQSPVMRPLHCQGQFKSILPLIPVSRDCLQQLSCSFPMTKCNTDVMANTVVTCQQLKASSMRINQLQILPSKGTELEIVAKFIICIIAYYQYLLFSCHILCKFFCLTRGILVPWDCSVKWSWAVPWSSPAPGKAGELPAHQWPRCASSGRVLQHVSDKHTSVNIHQDFSLTDMVLYLCFFCRNT